MELVYQTAGESLFDEEIRQACLRIPEVLTAVQVAQKDREWDLLATMSLTEQFAKLASAQKAELVGIVQSGLFARFQKSFPRLQEVVSRASFGSAPAVVNELRWRMRAAESVTIYVVGPGLDEIPRLLGERRVRFIDVIDQDPMLDWFWPNLKRAANA